jgi:hypothetical protein
MFNLDTFIQDYFHAETSGFFDKYWQKLPRELQVDDVVNFLKKNNLLEQMIDNLDDDCDVCLVRLDDGRYEYFRYDYKGKMDSEFFTNLEQGVRVKIKNIFLFLGH